MYLPAHKDALSELPPTNDCDDEYDLYYFFPSISPHTLVACSSAANPVGTAFDSAPRFNAEELEVLEVDDYCVEFDGPPPYSPPRSPTYVLQPDHTLPSSEVHDRIRIAGYSRLFRLGLASPPRQITRHLDALIRKLKSRLSKLKTKFFRL